MSQHWRGHWTDDAFMPTKLRNWEVPNWHLKWPDRHCTSTTFLTDNNGRILKQFKKYIRFPRKCFKGTWELPKKIDRKLADQLSAPDHYKQKFWELHKARNLAACQRLAKDQKLKKCQHFVSKSDQLSELKKHEAKYEHTWMTFFMKYSKPVCNIHRSSENGIIVTKFL